MVPARRGDLGALRGRGDVRDLPDPLRRPAVWRGRVARGRGRRSTRRAATSAACRARSRTGSCDWRSCAAGRAAPTRPRRFWPRRSEHRLAPLLRAALLLDRGDARAAVQEAERFLRRVGGDDRIRARRRARAPRPGPAPARRPPTAPSARPPSSSASPSPRARDLSARPRSSRAGVSSRPPRPERARGRRRHLRRLRGPLRGRAGVACARGGARGRSATRGRRGRLDAGAPGAGRARRTRAPPAPPGRSLLTARELEVLRLLARGLGESARSPPSSSLSVRTVERHVENLYGKIGVSGRTARAAATAWAIGNGLA